jgi:exopolysaccharide production protein ExoZ
MQTIVSIQAMRAVAAIAVMVCHFDIIRLWLAGRADEANPLYPLAAGVDLFFVISGFIMVVSSEKLFATPNGSWVFLARRIARVVPLYWITTLLAIPLMSLAVTPQALFASLFFIPYRLANDTIAPLYGVGWTLNFEMFFYALFSVALLWPRRFAVPLLAALLGCIVALGVWLSPQVAPLRWWSDPIILEFAFGMLIALAYQAKLTLPVAASLALIAIGTLAIWWSAPSQPPSGYRVLTWGIPAAMMLAGAVLAPPRFLEGPLSSWLTRLGDASYSIYLTHSLIGAAILVSWPRGLNRLPPVPVLVAAAALTIALSMVVYIVIERPLTLMARRASLRVSWR